MQVGYDDPDAIRCAGLAKLCMQRYYSIMLEPKQFLFRPVRLRTSINEFSHNDCKIFLSSDNPTYFVCCGDYDSLSNVIWMAVQL